MSRAKVAQYVQREVIGSMCGGLVKRVATILLAIAFLTGGLPRGVVAAMPATPGAGGLMIMHTAHCAPSAPDPAIPTRSTPALQHLNDCLACIAIDIPAGVGLPVPTRWFHFVYGSATLQLIGVSPSPELSPPIRRF